ncbi:hypothetical protein DPMN_069134 [Dreissena polymorpha]|uniref:Uncharacterized protein n=1 Tax=Dreissena polymorpha TaxID=45954 RepID=A0A9D3Z2X1_DREPO|nr:hypothetical protein DPMN_069134 [Dreissena polymorpha]
MDQSGALGKFRQQKERWIECKDGETTEFDVEDVGFVRESLQYLPYAPSLSFLRQELLVGPKTYFQIVGTLLLHKRILTQTEKRNAIYNFPGLCTGCMRMGLCYGCQKNPQLHYHEDRPVRTGGGFTYFKKDRPENEISAKHPMNWKIKHPEQALKMLMEEYAGVELEGALSDEVKRHLDLQHRTKGHTDAPVRSTIPDFAAEMKKLLSKGELRDGVLSDDHVAIAGDLKGDLEGEDQSGKRDHGRGHHPGDGDGAEYGHGQGQEGGTESDLEGYQGHYGSTVESEMEQHERMAVPSHSDQPQRKKKKRHDGKDTSEAIEDEAKRDHNYDEDGNRIRKYRKNESGERVTDTDSSNEDTEGETTSRGRRKQRLYKTPPAFKLKKSPTRRIEARSPFSTDRKYTLPKGKGLDIKKSDKKLTEFKDFKGGDVSWKEPKKFELKRKDTKTTKFWSGPPKSHATKGTKSNSPARQAHRVPSPRPVISPDSGLDSELLTA